MKYIVRRFRAGQQLAELVLAIDGQRGTDLAPNLVGSMKLTSKEWAQLLHLACETRPPEDDTPF